MSGESKLGVESLFVWVNDVLGLFAGLYHKYSQ
jgi:hypothetical protein